MEGSDETRSSFGTSSSSYHEYHKQLDIPNLNMSPFGTTMCQSSHNASPENNIKTPGIPPSPPNFPPSLPYLQIAMSQPASQQPISQNLGLGSPHSRSLSQPTFYSMNCLPPLSPFPHCEPSPTSDALTASLLRGNSFRSCENLPPRKGHQRSNSDIPFGFSAMIQSSPQLMPISGQGALGHLVPAIDNLVRDKPVQSVKQELNLDGNAEGMGERKSQREVADELLVTFMNLDNIDPLHSSCSEDKDMDSRASGTKPHGGEISDNEVESSTKGNPNGMRGSGFSFSTEKKEGVKRSAGGDIAPTARHFRSVSMDGFMGNFNLVDESPKLPPSLGTRVGQHSPSNSMDGNSLNFSLEFGNGEFSVAEMKKIMANEKLAEIALSDPKRVKRILANRQSAALSKERKVRYISELEHKVQTLQTEATTLSAQLTYLQRESAGLSSQNHELKFRLQAMEQQAQLRDALNEALTAEVQRLKLATAELRGEVRPANNMAQQNSMNL